MPSNDLKQILERIQAKDPAGFELLHQHHFRFLFSVAYAVLNNEEDSYDVVQSVMMRLYQLDETLFPRDHERSWLKTVVKNEALMHLRREKAAIPLEEAAELPAMDRHIEDFVDMDAFRRLTAPLSERQRKVVTQDPGRSDAQGDRPDAVPPHRHRPVDLRLLHQKTAPLPGGPGLAGPALRRRVCLSADAVPPGAGGDAGGCGHQQHPRGGARPLPLAARVPGAVSGVRRRLCAFPEIF